MPRSPHNRPQSLPKETPAFASLLETSLSILQVEDKQLPTYVKLSTFFKVVPSITMLGSGFIEILVIHKDRSLFFSLPPSLLSLSLSFSISLTHSLLLSPSLSLSLSFSVICLHVHASSYMNTHTHTHAHTQINIPVKSMYHTSAPDHIYLYTHTCTCMYSHTYNTIHTTASDLLLQRSEQREG